MIFDIITIFPGLFDSFLNESFIKKGQEKGLIKIRVHNLRDFAGDARGSVDDRPFGGGLGMVMKVEPIFKAVSSLKRRRKRRPGRSKIILFTPRGERFNQKMAYRFSRLDQLILICGRYEGVDERVAKYIADIKLSIGDYDLMGGELPAMVVMEAVARLIPGLIGKPQLLEERVPSVRGRGGRGFIEYAQYTRPEVFSPQKGIRWRVPKVLLSGHHKNIEEWRRKHRKIIEK